MKNLLMDDENINENSNDLNSDLIHLYRTVKGHNPKNKVWKESEPCINLLCLTQIIEGFYAFFQMSICIGTIIDLSIFSVCFIKPIRFLNSEITKTNIYFAAFEKIHDSLWILIILGSKNKNAIKSHEKELNLFYANNKIDTFIPLNIDQVKAVLIRVRRNPQKSYSEYISEIITNYQQPEIIKLIKTFAATKFKGFSRKNSVISSNLCNFKKGLFYLLEYYYERYKMKKNSDY